MRIAISITVLLALMYSVASAADHAACHADAVKFCAKTLHGDATQLSEVATCLVTHKHKLSGKCRAVLRAYGI